MHGQCPGDSDDLIKDMELSKVNCTYCTLNHTAELIIPLAIREFILSSGSAE